MIDTKQKLLYKKTPWRKLAFATGALVESAYLTYSSLSNDLYTGLTNFLNLNRDICSWIIHNPYSATLGTLAAIGVIKLTYYVMDKVAKMKGVEQTDKKEYGTHAVTFENYANKMIKWGTFLFAPGCISTCTNLYNAIITRPSNVEAWVNTGTPLVVTGTALAAAISLKHVIKYALNGGHNVKEFIKATMMADE